MDIHPLDLYYAKGMVKMDLNFSQIMRAEKLKRWLVKLFA